jgi:tetratricopeptide (TPR) repeat protein
MRPRSRIGRVFVASIAAILLMTGVLNLRSAFGSGSGNVWDTDPSGQSQIDRLTGAAIRQPSDLDAQIVSYQDEIRAHPNNGDAKTYLAFAYLQKVREVGDPSYYPKIAELLKQAFDANDQDFNAATGLGTLALARHDFSGALTWGERAKAINAYSAPAYGVIGDALVELGRYDEAIDVVQQMVNLRPDLASFSRVSYLRELTGDIPGAVDAMQKASEAGAARPENVAWTQAQLGNLAFNQGDLDTAQQMYEASLYTLDDYVYGTAGLAKVAAARGDFATAETDFAAAIKIMPLPEFVIALGETYQAAGEQDLAAQQYALVQAMIQLYAQNGVNSDVELALFLADHGTDMNDALAKARAGFDKRPSIKGADVLGWTLYRAGQYQEAQQYSQQALRLGTKDSSMLFHAGMIAAARGDKAGAISFLQRALAINPSFSPINAPIAKQTLATLTAG